MKWSVYNTLADNGDGNYILYNTLSEKMIVTVEQIRALLDEYRNNIDAIEQIHPDLFHYLAEQEFIVPNETNEVEKLITLKGKACSKTDYFSITVNPTMNCNLRCWYCYETHKAGSGMGQETIDLVRVLIKRKMESYELKEFHLSFFGGEPLLEFTSCVKPLTEYALELSWKHEKTLSIGFTTNAVLLNKKVVDFLANTGLDVHLQVPFDGGRIQHDSIKKHPNGRGTYNRIFSNINYGLSKGLSFLIRCNYTDQNIDSFSELIDDFKEIYKEHEDKLAFSFQQIWQQKDTKETLETVKKFEKILEKIGVEYDSLHNISSCYADREHSIVINYNGDIYKCTARDFLPELREGILHADGAISYNERYHDRMESRFSNKTCLGCRIFPICNVCTQKRLEEFEEDVCVRDISEQEKDGVILDRIKAISTGKIIDNRNIIH